MRKSKKNHVLMGVKINLLEVDGVIDGVSECLSIKTGLLYLTKLKLVPTTFDSSSTPVARIE